MPSLNMEDSHLNTVLDFKFGHRSSVTEDLAEQRAKYVLPSMVFLCCLEREKKTDFHF